MAAAKIRAPEREERPAQGCPSHQIHPRFKLISSAKLGCTNLISGLDMSQQPPCQISAKLIPSSQLSNFLSSEGMVHVKVSANPHPNLPSIRDSLDVDGQGYLILQPFFGDLHSFMKEHRTLSEGQAKHFFQQVVEAVHHCHSLHIVLRDIKLGKLMFGDRNQAKVVLADLDGAEYIGERRLLSDQKGSPAYVAPEVLLGQPYDGYRADIWSLGVVMYILLTGTYPFQDQNPKSLFEKILRADPIYPNTLSSEARSLLQQLLCRNPRDRIPTSGIRQHAWFKSNTEMEELKEESKTAEADVPSVPDIDDQVVPNADNTMNNADNAMNLKRKRPDQKHDSDGCSSAIRRKHSEI